jgi:hypothetical protein
MNQSNKTGRTRSGRTRPGRRYAAWPNTDIVRLSLYERISRYIAACPEAIEGQRGDETTYRVACRLVWGFGLSESDALQWLRRYNDIRCSPKWTERELKAKIAQAFKRRKHLPRGEFLNPNL